MLVAVLSGLILLLLAVPVDVAFRCQRVDAFKGQFTVRWLFGMLRFQVPMRAAPQAPVKVKRRGARAHAVSLLRQAAFRRRLVRLARDLLRAAHVRDLGLRLRLGLGDPADTGRLWAVMGPLSGAAQGLRDARIRIEPEFLDAVFEFEAEGRFLLVPLQYLLLIIGFALSPSSIRAWRSRTASHA